MFVSCSAGRDQFTLNKWQFSVDDDVYIDISCDDLSNLSDFVPYDKGFVFLKSEFDVGDEFVFDNYAISIGRISLASEIYFNGKRMVSTGLFPPNKFSNGANCTFIPLSPSLVDFEGKNELKIKIYMEGSGGVYGVPCFGEYDDVYNSYSLKNFFNSRILLIFATFLLFTSFIYLVMFIKMQNDPAMLMYSLLSFVTILFLFPSFIGNLPWLIGFMSYDWFIKIFQGVVGVLLAFMAVSFSLHFLGVRQPRKFVMSRTFLMALGCIYCLCIPNYLYFQKLSVVTGIVMIFQILPAIPAIIIGLKIKKYVLASIAKGEAPFGEANAPKRGLFGSDKLPKGVTKLLNGKMKGPPPGSPLHGANISNGGKIDDIALAQMEFAQSSFGTIKQLLIAFTPTYITMIIDLFFHDGGGIASVLYLTLFGWQITILIFLFMLISSFSAVRRRGESIAHRLRELVEKNTKELWKQKEELEKKQRQSDKELEMAAQVQKTFYNIKSDFYGWDIGVKFQPLASVSGDLYDFYELEGKLRGFGLFDVSGHGLSAALVTMVAKSAIFRTFRSSLPISLSEAILRVNQEIIRTKGNIENYLTGIIFRIDRDDPSKVELVNAGSPYPILKKSNGETKFLKPEVEDVKAQHGMLGISGLDVAFCTIPFEFDYDDVLVLCTDGITEAENKKGEQYGKDRLLKIVSEIANEETANVFADKIKEDVDNFITHQPYDDDVTLIVVKRIKEDEEELDDLETLEEIE